MMAGLLAHGSVPWHPSRSCRPVDMLPWLLVYSCGGSCGFGSFKDTPHHIPFSSTLFVAKGRTIGRSCRIFESRCQSGRRIFHVSANHARLGCRFGQEVLPQNKIAALTDRESRVYTSASLRGHLQSHETQISTHSKSLAHLVRHCIAVGWFCPQARHGGCFFSVRNCRLSIAGRHFRRSLHQPRCRETQWQNG